MSFWPIIWTFFGPRNCTSSEPRNCTSFRPINRTSFGPINRTSFGPRIWTSFGPINRTSFGPRIWTSFGPVIWTSKNVAKGPISGPKWDVHCRPNLDLFKTYMCSLGFFNTDDSAIFVFMNSHGGKFCMFYVFY